MYHPEDLPRIHRFLGFRRGMTVLDVGCGAGYLAELCSVKTGPGTVTGVDTDRDLLGHARHRARKDGLGIAYRKGDAFRLPFKDDRFDLAAEQLTLVHLRNPLRAIGEMVRVAKPGGWVAAFECIYETSGSTEYDAMDDDPGYRDLREQSAEMFRDIVRRVDRYNRKRGLDRFLAIKLPALFRRAGLETVEARPFAHLRRWQGDAKKDVRRLLVERIEKQRRYGFRPRDIFIIREAVEAGTPPGLLKRYNELDIRITQYCLDHYEAFRRGLDEALLAYSILAVKGRKPA